MRPSEMPSWSAWMIERAKRRRLGHVEALGEVLERLDAALADAHLVEHDRELLEQRALRALGDACEGAVEAEAGLDRDGQEVEHLGQLDQHVGATGARHARRR